MSQRRWARPLLLAAGVAVLASYWWQTPAAPTPAATFQLGSGAAVRPARNYEELPGESAYRLEVYGAIGTCWYVLSHNVVDGTVVLWPSPDLRSDLAQPLTSERACLPGKVDARELAWTTRSELRGTTTVLVLASASPIPALEEALPRLRRWTNSVLTDRTMLVTKPKVGEEPLGPPLSSEFPLPMLRAAAQATITSDQPNGPLAPLAGHPGVWCTAWRFTEKPGSPPMQNPLQGR